MREAVGKPGRLPACCCCEFRLAGVGFGFFHCLTPTAAGDRNIANLTKALPSVHVFMWPQPVLIPTVPSRKRVMRPLCAHIHHPQSSPAPCGAYFPETGSRRSISRAARHTSSGAGPPTREPRRRHDGASTGCPTIAPRRR